MSYFEKLPVELWYLVFQCIEPGILHQSFTVSKSWYSIAERVACEDLRFTTSALVNFPHWDEATLARRAAAAKRLTLSILCYHGLPRPSIWCSNCSVEGKSLNLETYLASVAARQSFRLLDYDELPLTLKHCTICASCMIPPWIKRVDESYQALAATVASMEKVDTFHFRVDALTGYNGPPVLRLHPPISLLDAFKHTNLTKLILDTEGTRLSWRCNDIDTPDELETHVCHSIATLIPQLQYLFVRTGSVCPLLIHPGVIGTASCLKTLIIVLAVPSTCRPNQPVKFAVQCPEYKIHAGMLWRSMMYAVRNSLNCLPRINKARVIGYRGPNRRPRNHNASDVKFIAWDCMDGQPYLVEDGKWEDDGPLSAEWGWGESLV